MAANRARDGEAAILAVDDHPFNLLALASLLRPLGYSVVTAGSGAEALEIAERQDFVLILMDVHMPALDGYRTMELLRRTARARAVPVVFLSAVHSSIEHLRRGYALGAVDYVTKPFDPDVLCAKVTALVSLYTMGRREERASREEMDRLKDLVFGAVGHDLRNPLNVILAGAHALMRGAACSEEGLRATAERMARSAHRMTEILEDILDLTRGKFASGMPLRLETVDAAETCRSAIAELSALHSERRIELRIEGETTGTWDPTRLGRVVSNLVCNAVKHTSERTIAVGVAGNPAAVTLTVHNRGAPIPPEILPRLFEPFRRGDTAADGVGLGLHIVRQISEAHGGTVHVESTVERGTTFTVTLPRRGPSAGQSAGEPPPVALSSAS
jgi:signal transduction histidine kinase